MLVTAHRSDWSPVSALTLAEIKQLKLLAATGHDDERAVDDPDGAYGWMLTQNVGIIQTAPPTS